MSGNGLVNWPEDNKDRKTRKACGPSKHEWVKDIQLPCVDGTGEEFFVTSYDCTKCSSELHEVNYREL